MAPLPWSAVPLVGRSQELARLHASFERAEQGTSWAVVVEGEAGIGKSRLVSEFSGEMREAGALVLVGRCVKCTGGGLPLGPVAEALRPAIGRLGSGPTTTGGTGHPELARLVPEMVEGTTEVIGGDSMVGSSRTQLFEKLLLQVQRLSQATTLVLVLEDLHWADDSTRDLLAYLVANLRHERVMLVGTVRTDELPRGHPITSLVAELDRSETVTRLQLGPLGSAELFEGVTALMGGAPLPAQRFEAIWARSQGNPFFAGELLAAETSASVTGLPVTLQQILLARLMAVPPAAQHVVRVAAAAGCPVHHRLLAAVADLPEPDLLAAVRQAIAHQLLVVASGTAAYDFRHALLEEVAYGELVPGERLAVHARYGRAIEEHPELAGPGAAGQLAYHWFEAGELEKALAASIKAARAAEDVFGFAEAQQHLERALRVLASLPAGTSDPGVDDRMELLEHTASTAHAAGNHARAVELVTKALGGIDPEVSPVRAGLLHERLATYLWAAGDSEAALGAHEEAIRLVPLAPPSADRARVLAAHGRALMLVARYRESRDRCVEAVAMARELGATVVESHALSTLGFDEALLGEPDVGVAHLRDALRIAEDVSNPDDVGQAYVNLTELLAGPLNRAEEAVAVASQGAARVGQLGVGRQYAASLLAIAANGLFRLGAWDEADALLSRAFADGPSGAAAIDLRLARAKILVARGLFDAASEELAAARTLAARAIDPRYHAPLCTLEAGLAMWEGRLDDARRAVVDGLEHVGRTEDEWFVPPLLWHGARLEADGAERARWQDQRAVAGSRIAACQGYVARMTELALASTGAAPPSALILLSYARMTEAEMSRAEGTSDPGRWLIACESWRQVGQPYPEAYARWRYGEALLLEDARSTEAVRALHEARRIAQVLGAEPLLAEIVELAGQARIDLDPSPAEPRASTSSVPVPPALAGLTGRQLEVLELLTSGQTNREVGESLFINTKTVSAHLSEIYRKLDVTGRVGAIRVARANGLGSVGPPI